MDKSRKLGALLGFSALAVALLGITLLLGDPASAGDGGGGPDNGCEGNQGLTTANLGI